MLNRPADASSSTNSKLSLSIHSQSQSQSQSHSYSDSHFDSRIKRSNLSDLLNDTPEMTTANNSYLHPQQQQHQQHQQSNPGSGIVANGSVATSNSIRPEKSKKSRRKSSSDETKVLISTSSPEGIAAAAQITSNRVANILLSEGPLPIRHLTSHLVSQVPAFGHLSLSKQRRLIMAALESGDSVNCCVFEKVGWGQWEARRTTTEEVNNRINSSFVSASASTSASAANNNINASSGNHHSSSSGSSGSGSSGSSTSNTTSTSVSTNNNIRGHSPDSPVKDEYNNSNNNNSHRPMTNNYGRKNSKTTSTVNFRRDSITNPQTDLHNTKLPVSPSLQPLQNLRNSFRNRNIILDEAIESSSEDDDDELEDTPPLPGDDEDGMFSLDGEYRRRHNTNSNGGGSGIRSGSNSRRPSFGGIVKPRKPRTSFTSQSIEAALDDSVSLDKRRPRVSFSNSSTVARESFVRKPLSSPRHNPIMMNDQNISNSTISSIGTNNNSNSNINNGNGNGNGNGSKRHSQQYGSNTTGRNVNGNGVDDEHDNFTDEEDWATNGPSNVRRQASIVSSPFGATSVNNLPSIILNNNNDAKHLNVNGNGKAGGLKNGKSDEEIAAFALMDLRSDA
ncbi:unnamed protein product [Ambrosiozyma monospora]|uniref:Unnamed protein product n=1 Tax=Ambrosiozyma monospora TaxID=43982 RepID=A0A9W6Z287_AMBMO|nr:unnamed protein product [Ambrosiozyma monospora]